MTLARTFKGALVAVLLAGLGFMLTLLVDGRPGLVPNKSPRRGTIPLDCRIALAGEAEQRAWLEKSSWFERWPYLLTREVLRNPLLADKLTVEVENTSGGDFGLYTSSGDPKPFRFGVRIEDTAGQPVRFPHAGQSGIKRLGPTIGIDNPDLISPIVTLKRGQVVTDPEHVWRPLNIHDVPSPGRYRVRVACFYSRVPDGQTVEVESAPLIVTVTARDIREWKALSEASDRLFPW